MKTSELYTINWRDLAHGLIIAAGTAAFTVIENSLNAGTLMIKWKQAGLDAAAAALSYIGKNFFTPSKTLSNEIK